MTQFRPVVPQPVSSDDDLAEYRATREVFAQAARAALRLLEGLPAEYSNDSPHTDGPLGRLSPAGTAAVVENSVVRSQGWMVAGGDGPGDGQPDRRLLQLRVAVKDVIDVADQPTRNGTKGGGWRDPVESSPAWDLLAGEGAVCVGKAATHEMAWGVTTPGIRNPLDPSRIAGGSSGGSAAAVAAGLADAALGTDTGGSIRIPAALCGVVGIRPTLGSVPMAGITPLAPSQDVVGPLARDVATCAVVLEILQRRALVGAAPAGMRVGVPHDLGALDRTVAASWEETLSSMEAAGVELVMLTERTPLREAGAASLLTMLLESASQHADRVYANPEGYSGETRALLTLGTVLAEHLPAVTLARETLRRLTARVFGENHLAAVVTPTTPCVAPPYEARTIRLGGRSVPVSVALTRFTAWASVIGSPAITVPTTTRGLPVGVQIMAAPGAESTCLSLAGLVERQTRAI